MSDALNPKSLKSRVSDELNALRKQEIAKHRRGNFKDEGSAFLTPEEAKNYLLELQSDKKKKKVQPKPPTNLPTTELNDWYSQQRKMHLMEQKKRVEAETFLRGYRSKYVKKDDGKQTDDDTTKVPVNDMTDSIIEDGLDDVMLEVDKLNQSNIVDDDDNDEVDEVDEVIIDIDENENKEVDKDENNDKDKDEDMEEKEKENKDKHDQKDNKTGEDVVNIEIENEKVDSSPSLKSDDDKDNEDTNDKDKDNENENNIQSNEVDKEEPADSQKSTDDDDTNVNDDQNSNDVTKDAKPIDGSEQTTEIEGIDEESKNELKINHEEGKNDESEIDQDEVDETKVLDQEEKDEPEIDQNEVDKPNNDQVDVLLKEPTELEEVVPETSSETEKEVLENEEEAVNEDEEIVKNEEEVVKEEEIVENEEDAVKEEEEKKDEVPLFEDNENTIATEKGEPEETANDNEEEEVINQDKIEEEEDKIEEEEDKINLKEEVTKEEDSSEDISHARGLNRTDSFVVRKESSDKDSTADVEEEEEEESWRDMISREPGAKFAPEPDRYHLYVSHACPWAHRTVMVLALKGLEKVIGLTYVHPTWQYTKPGVDEHRGWVFGSDDGKPLSSTSGAGSFPTSWGEEDPNMGAKTIRDIYEEVNDTTERYILPILWDNKLKTIVSNESSEIIRMLNLEFNEYASNPDLDLYPESLVEQIDEINQWIYPSFNNGVYRCGLASTQECYDVAIDELTEAFDKIDSILQKQRYIAGDTFTEADVRLFVTLIRFDEVYDIYFKTNTRSVSSTPAVLNYVRDIYQMDNVAKTCVMDMIKAHYYTSHVELNKYSIIPRGVNFIALLDKPHHRESLS